MFLSLSNLQFAFDNCYVPPGWQKFASKYYFCMSGTSVNIVIIKAVPFTVQTKSLMHLFSNTERNIHGLLENVKREIY